MHHSRYTGSEDQAESTPCLANAASRSLKMAHVPTLVDRGNTNI
jgi:hypothetical protein